MKRRYKNSDRKQMEIESNSSNIDLFGSKVNDDVCEQILSYLPLRDKIKLEEVSKQWYRCMFKRQTVIKLNDSQTAREDNDTLNELLKPIQKVDYHTAWALSERFQQINAKHFEYVLKRCQSIKTLELRCFVGDNELQLIDEHLKYLDTLVMNMYNITANGLIKFGQNYDQNLKKLHLLSPESPINIDLSYIKDFLEYCPKLLEIHSENSLKYISVEKTFLPNLQSILLYETDYLFHENECENFGKLTEIYGNQLKHINISVRNYTSVSSIVPRINSFVKLEKLGLKLCSGYFDDGVDVSNIPKYVINISEDCRQLKYFAFEWNSYDSLSHMFLSFSKFYSCETIDIRLTNASKLIECKSEYFKTCSNLKHLRVSYPFITDEFFKDIDQHIPNLRSIDIYTKKPLTDESLLSLAKLNNLKRVLFRQNGFANEYITDLGVCRLIESCIHIEHICFDSTPKITNETVDRLTEIASQRNKKTIKLKCCLSESRDELQYEQPIDNNRLNDLPNNLKIDYLLNERLQD